MASLCSTILISPGLVVFSPAIPTSIGVIIPPARVTKQLLFHQLYRYNANMTFPDLHLSWSILDHVQAVLTLIISLFVAFGLVAGIKFVLSQRKLYRQLLANEEAIRKKQDGIDAVEQDVNRRTSGHLVNETQRLAQVNVSKEPLLRNLERLREEREFIKGRLVFLPRRQA